MKINLNLVGAVISGVAALIAAGTDHYFWFGANGTVSVINAYIYFVYGGAVIERVTPQDIGLSDD